MEDKKCRICGMADLENTNIFHSKTLLTKLVAVYPIVLYKNDPLPKHICKKCHVTTTMMYHEVEKALKNQNKWIANIRLAQPDNQYLKVVDSIAGSNKQTSQLVSLIAGNEIGERTISKLFNFEMEHQTKKNSTPSPTEQTESEKTDDTKKTSSEPQQSQIPESLPPETKITELKSVLELNGCTLTKLKPTPKSNRKSISKPKEKKEIKEMEIKIKEEPLDEENQIPIIEQPIVGEQHLVPCKMCTYSCETVEELAIHQLEHLSISALKLSERRILSKRIRRGRLIMVEEKKCIRCLNCWRIFADNKSILQHWSEGDCDYFCQICGREFASSPKMLREHMPAAHGISYRSSKILRPPTIIPRKPNKTEKIPIKLNEKVLNIKVEPSSSLSSPPLSAEKTTVAPVKKRIVKPTPRHLLTAKVACNICLKVFANFKARNSHMRAHKHPPFLPDMPPPPLDEALLSLNRHDLVKIKDEPMDLDIPFQETNTAVIAPVTNRAGPAFSKITPPVKHPRLKDLNPRVNHGARKKITPKKPYPEEDIKMKSIVDLQDPCVSSQLAEDSDKLVYDETSTSTPSPNLTNSSFSGSTSINGLSFDFGAAPKDNMNYAQVFTCHPCGSKFNSKLELFRHKRKCTANKFPCQFCDRQFVTSADLQMHIMLLHKSISA